MDGELPAIESHLVDQRLLKIKSFFQSIPFPEGQPNEDEEEQVSLFSSSFFVIPCHWKNRNLWKNSTILVRRLRKRQTWSKA